MNVTHSAIQKKVQRLQEELQNMTSKRVVVMISVEPEKKLDYNTIAMAVCLVTGITYSQVLTGVRKERYALTRHLICYYSYQFTCLSLQEVADNLGLDNHTSVMHACKRITEMIKKNDQKIVEIIPKINNALNPTQQ